MTVASKFNVILGKKSRLLQVETSPGITEPGFRAEKSGIVYTLPSAFAVPQRQAPPPPPTIQHSVPIRA